MEQRTVAPYQAHAKPGEHTLRRIVGVLAFGEHPLQAGLREGVADERTCRLGGVAVAAVCRDQPVAELHLPPFVGEVGEAGAADQGTIGTMGHDPHPALPGGQFQEGALHEVEDLLEVRPGPVRRHSEVQGVGQGLAGPQGQSQQLQAVGDQRQAFGIDPIVRYRISPG